jgi:hypothetical protein
MIAAADFLLRESAARRHRQSSTTCTPCTAPAPHAAGAPRRYGLVVAQVEGDGERSTLFSDVAESSLCGGTSADRLPSALKRLGKSSRTTFVGERSEMLSASSIGRKRICPPFAVRNLSDTRAFRVDGDDVKKVEDYRQHANECRSMANRFRSPEERAMLLNMATTWDSLAVDHEAPIERQKRLAAFERGSDGRQSAQSIPVDRLNASNDD